MTILFSFSKTIHAEAIKHKEEGQVLGLTWTSASPRLRDAPEAEPRRWFSGCPGCLRCAGPKREDEVHYKTQQQQKTIKKKKSQALF